MHQWDDDGMCVISDAGLCVCGWAWLPDVACVCASLRYSESMCLCLSPDSGNILPHVFYILKTCWASFDKSAGDLNTLHLSSMIQVSVHCKYDGTHPVFSLPVSVRFGTTRTVPGDSTAQSSVVAQLSAHAPGPWKPMQDMQMETVGRGAISGWTKWETSGQFWGHFCQAAR